MVNSLRTMIILWAFVYYKEYVLLVYWGNTKDSLVKKLLSFLKVTSGLTDWGPSTKGIGPSTSMLAHDY